jgi:transposase
MRFVPTKTLEQQSCLMLHRTRHLFIRQQTVRTGIMVGSTQHLGLADFKRDE